MTSSFPRYIDAENGNGDARRVHVSTASAGRHAFTPGAAYLHVPGQRGVTDVWLSPESTKALSEALAAIVALGAPTPEPVVEEPTPTVFEPGTRVRIATDATFGHGTFGPGFMLTEAARGSVGVVLEGPDSDDDYYVGGIEDFGGRSQWVAGTALTAEPETAPEVIPDPNPPLFEKGARVVVLPGAVWGNGEESSVLAAGTVGTITNLYGPDSDGDYLVAPDDGDGSDEYVDAFSLVPAPAEEPSAPAYAVGDKVIVACRYNFATCNGPATVVRVDVDGSFVTKPDANDTEIGHFPDELTPAPVEEEPAPEPAPSFSAGDVVEFRPVGTRTQWAAKPGALALVTADYNGTGFLRIRWVSTSSNDQYDGGYDAADFTPATLTGRLAEVTEREPWSASLLPGDVVKIVSEPRVSLGELAVWTTGASAWAREQGTRAWTLPLSALKIVD